MRRWVEPVVWSSPEGDGSRSWWSSERVPLGLLSESDPAQGISPTAGVLLPHSLQLPVLANRQQVRVDVLSGSLQLDALLVRPVASRLVLTGEGGVTELVHSSTATPQPIRVGRDGESSTVVVYDESGARSPDV